MTLRLGFNILALLGSGALAGVLLTIGLSFGSYWQSLPPTSFLDWFTTNIRFVPRAVPPTVTVAVIGLAGSLWLDWSMPRERVLWAAALACVLLMLVITAVWNGPLNARFISGQIAATEVPDALGFWLTTHAVRVVLMIAATVLGIVAAAPMSSRHL